MDAEPLPAPSEDERTMALLAHVLMIVTGFIGPLVIYLVKRESRFIAFHALQALFWQIAYLLVMIVGGVAWFAFLFAMGGAGKAQGPPAAFIATFFLFWLLMMGAWVLTLVLGIVYGIKASRGEWAAYLIFGAWARRAAGV